MAHIKLLRSSGTMTRKLWLSPCTDLGVQALKVGGTKNTVVGNWQQPQK